MDIVFKVSSGMRPTGEVPANTPKNVSTPNISTIFAFLQLTEKILCLMEACWAQNPEDRPSFVDIIAELDPKVLSDVV